MDAAVRGLDACRAALLSGEYALVVLDEANVAAALRLIDVESLVELIEARPAGVELVLTGRWAPQAVLRRADLVTEMREVKHYYRRGVLAQRDRELRAVRGQGASPAPVTSTSAPLARLEADLPHGRTRLDGGRRRVTGRIDGHQSHASGKSHGGEGGLHGIAVHEHHVAPAVLFAAKVFHDQFGALDARDQSVGR